MKLLPLFTMLLASSTLFAQSGWKTVKDKTDACKISVPPNWTLLSTAGMANSPQNTSTIVIRGNTHFSHFSDMTLKMLNIDKVFENSASRIFYVTKPGSGNPSLVTYHVEVPGKGNSCIAEIYLRPNTLEDDARKIALSLSPVP